MTLRDYSEMLAVIDSTIVVAALGFLGGGWGLYEWLGKRLLRQLLTQRRQSQLRRFVPLQSVPSAKALFSGNWVGTTEVRDDGEARKYRGRYRFSRGSETEVTGELDVIIIEDEDQERSWTLHFVGGFLNERTLVLDYWSEEPNVYQFGTIILEYEDENSFIGKFVARGRDLNRLIYGRAALRRSEGRAARA
jgi:hypothetical protein